MLDDDLELDIETPYQGFQRLNIQLSQGFYVNTATSLITPAACTPLIQGSGDTAAHTTALQMITAQYQKHFNCQLHHAMPHSLSQTAAEDGQIVACTGYQAAAQGPLFLEQYLDESVEECLQRLGGKSVAREEIVEIGGFAVSDRRHALPFMLQLAPTLADLGFKTVVCTVTRPVQACLRKLGIISTFIKDADASRVDTSNNAWGTYYDLKPVVLAGDIHANIDKIRPFIKLLGGMA